MTVWEQFWSDVSVLDVAVVVVGIAAVGFFVVKVWPFVRRFVRTVDALADLPNFMTSTKTQIEGIHHETHRNDGSSIKDATVRIETGVAGLYRVLGRVVKDNPELAAELADTQPAHHIR